MDPIPLQTDTYGKTFQFIKLKSQNKFQIKLNQNFNSTL